VWRLRTDISSEVEAVVRQVVPPCQMACPINEDIQRTNVLISLLPQDPRAAREGIIQIGDYLYEHNPLFTVCGYICGLCERECNYKTKGGSIKRRLLKRFLADTYSEYLAEKKPLYLNKDKEKVGVIGGGPAGLFCAWELSKRGYNVTIFESSPKLGGALRYIPRYRLPEEVVDRAVGSLVRLAGIKVRTEVSFQGDPLSRLEAEGFRAFFIATGTHYPRPLTFAGEKVPGQDLEGVMYGLTLLAEVNMGNVAPGRFAGRRVLVIGGGNVAFDVARTARRLGGTVTVVCLECEDKSCRDGIPADEEEIAGAQEEGIKIVYSRGVSKILSRDGRFAGIECPKCVRVYDELGFNPKFDLGDCITLEGDVLLIAIGQSPDRGFLQRAGLLDERGRLLVDPFTLQSEKKEQVFIGGDARKVGFAAEAMKEGKDAAESIDKYLRGISLRRRQIVAYEPCPSPQRKSYRPEPELKWRPPEERLNFELFEEGLTLEEAIWEARRCLTCGPCASCKACVSLGIQPVLPAVKVTEELCSGCGVCVSACNYGAALIKELEGGKLVSYTDSLHCKACGMCVVACPTGARKFFPEESHEADQLRVTGPKIVCFYCKFGWGYTAEKRPSAGNLVPVACLGKVDAEDILRAFREGAEGVLLLGCARKECHFQDGDSETMKKVHLVRRVLEAWGIDPARVEVVFSFDPEGENIARLVEEMASRIKAMKPLSAVRARFEELALVAGGEASD